MCADDSVIVETPNFASAFLDKKNYMIKHKKQVILHFFNELFSFSSFESIISQHSILLHFLIQSGADQGMRVGGWLGDKFCAKRAKNFKGHAENHAQFFAHMICHVAKKNSDILMTVAERLVQLVRF